jgi:Tfp pilus assembly protein PilN
MKKRINLILPKEQGLSDKIIYFALHYLRYILVLTQMVVIGVFFYRFKVDQQIIDLKDELSQKQEIVAVSRPLVDEGRLLDLKIKSIADILQKQALTSQILEYLLSNFPEKIKLKSLKITEKQIEMNGISEDPIIIQIYYQRLLEEKKFDQVNLRSITKTANGFTFDMSFVNFQYKFL